MEYCRNQKRAVKMLSPDTFNTRNSNTSSIDEDAEKLGIKRIDVQYYLYHQYRYTDVKDAIAQAKRDEAIGKSEGSS